MSMFPIRVCLVLSLFVFVECAHSQDKNNGLKKAIFARNYNLVEQILANGGNVNEGDQFGGSPLVWAVMEDDTQMLRILIHHGANIHMLVIPPGNTLLETCMAMKKYNAAKFLLHNGFNIDTLDNLGMTALISAASNEDLSSVSFLIKNGANVNYSAGKFIRTPLSGLLSATEVEEYHLHHISRPAFNKLDSETFRRHQLSLQIGELLLEAGANPNVRISSDSGNTYLYIAAKQCDTAMARLLIKYGANKAIRNDYGRRPYDAALQSDCSGMEILLK